MSLYHSDLLRTGPPNSNHFGRLAFANCLDSGHLIEFVLQFCLFKLAITVLLLESSPVTVEVVEDLLVKLSLAIGGSGSPWLSGEDA